MSRHRGKNLLQEIKTIENFEISGKTIFIRVDFNVPMENGKILDDSRIKGAISTIRYALDKGAKLVLGSHLGRPRGGDHIKEDREKLSLEPVAKHLSELMGIEVILIEDPTSDAPKALLNTIKENQVLLLENLRFDPGETKNTGELVEAICEYTDIYINDAFGASHRAHASIVGLPRAIKDFGCGLLVKKEIQMLNMVLDKAESPYVAVLGGSKVSDKIGMIENLMGQVDTFIIGGAMSYTFLKAQGFGVGSSLVEEDKLNFARKLIKRIELRGKKILLPMDHVIVQGLDAPKENSRITQAESIDEGNMGVDIGPKTIKLYESELAKAQTIFWNGPMGIFERKGFEKGTFVVAEATAKNSGITIIGGGDSASAARLAGVEGRMTHISTGGGASLEFLQGDILPGLQVLRILRTPTEQAVLDTSEGADW